MSLNGFTHTEDGNHYVIKVPMKEFSGKRLGTQFIAGVGRTNYRAKAIEFDDRWNYEVTRPANSEPWELSESPVAEIGTEYAAEASVAVAIEDEDPGYGDLSRPD